MMILFKQGINACNLETDSCELIWIELLSKHGSTLFIFSIAHHAVETALQFINRLYSATDMTWYNIKCKVHIQVGLH